MLTLRDLFQVVFEMKKKEMNNALKNKEILMDVAKVRAIEEQSNNEALTSASQGSSEVCFIQRVHFDSLFDVQRDISQEFNFES